MLFLTFKDTVKFARYLHDACYAANENLSAVESSAVLNCSWALGKLWSPALVTWTCALWSSKLACLLELNGSRRSGGSSLEES